MGSGAMMMENGARKRCAPEDRPGEKSVERRHRRMIKNRESAARSRARKQVSVVLLVNYSLFVQCQFWHGADRAGDTHSVVLMLQAYTVELEAELNHLKEENARLKAEEVLISY
jgi:ABA responsive element binding factor